MNKVILIGRTTTDFELMYTKNGNAVAKVNLAVDRRYKNTNGERETDFIPVVAWGKLAEIAAEYVKKGKQVAIEGELQIRTYLKDSEKRYIAEVIATDIQFIDRMEMK